MQKYQSLFGFCSWDSRDELFATGLLNPVKFHRGSFLVTVLVLKKMYLKCYPIIQLLILSTSNQLPYCPILSKLSVLKLPHYLIDENVTGVLPHYAIICKFITTTCSLFVVVYLSGLFGEKETRRLYDQIQRKQLERKGQCKVEMVIANVDQKDAVQAIFKVTVSGSQDRARRSASPQYSRCRCPCRSPWPSRRRRPFPRPLWQK